MRKFYWAAMAALPALSSSLAFAADNDGSSSGWAKLGAGLAIAIGAAGAATGQGNAASSALEGIARNPTSRGEVFGPLLLSLAFMEFQALMSFVIAFLLQA